MAQQTMYPAQSNSPSTELSAAITDTATTLSVLSAVGLPAAPNLITIGSDDTAEVVRYTAINGTTLTIERGFGGTTAKAWPKATKVARYFTAYDHESFRQNIADLDARTGNVDLTASLGPGTSVINADQASDVDLTVYGMTRVNLLGADGNFEVDSNGDGVADGWGFTLFGATPTLETANVKYGVKAQRITALTTDTGAARRIERIVSVTANKKYVFIADVVTDGSSRARIRFDYAASSYAESSPVATNKVHFVKFTPTADYTGYARLYNNSDIGAAGWVQFDGAGLFEVPDDLYARIGVDINESNIRDYLPHVDGKQHVNGVIVSKQGKNIYDGGIAAKSNGTVEYTEDISTSTLTVTSGSGLYHYVITKRYAVAPNTTYTLSYSSTSVSGADIPQVGVRKGSDNGTTLMIISSGIGAKSVTFNSGSETEIILFFYGSTTTAAVQTKRYVNIQLEVGSLSTPFELANPQRLILPVTLASTPDGNARDTAYYRDGAWRMMKRVDTSVDPAVALGTPVESVISKAEGAITLHPGGNQITVETGVIQREKVTFNASTKQGTTSKRSARIIGVYKGANPEPFTTYTSGGQTLPQLVNAVESGKDYYVTYIALDKYALTTNVTKADAQYKAGLNGTVSDVVRDVARLAQQNSRQDFADTYIQAMAENNRLDIDTIKSTGETVTGAQAKVNAAVGDLASLQTTAKGNAVAAINELFTSVANGKNDIASAISGKGVPASGSDTFATLASKIGQITTSITSLKYTSFGSTSTSGTLANLAFKPLFVLFEVNFKSQYYNSSTYSYSYGTILIGGGMIDNAGATTVLVPAAVDVYGYSGGSTRTEAVITLSSLNFGANFINYTLSPNNEILDTGVFDVTKVFVFGV